MVRSDCGAVGAHLSWGTAIVTLVFGAVPLLVLVGVPIKPRQTAVYPYDATLSFAEEDDIMPTVMFLPISMAITLGNILIAEFAVAKGLTNPQRIINTLQAILFMLCGFCWEVLFQQSIAKLTGQPRPSYLQQCQPDVNVIQAQEELGMQPMVRPQDCTAPGGREENLLQAFPSGHAGSAMFIGLLGIFYLAWTVAYRQPLKHLTSMKQFLVEDIKFSLLGVWLLACFAYAGWIGVSRHIDHHHSVADIAAGDIIGTLLAIWAFHFILRSIRRVDAQWAFAAHDDDALRDMESGNANSPRLVAAVGGPAKNANDARQRNPAYTYAHPALGSAHRNGNAASGYVSASSAGGASPRAA